MTYFKMVLFLRVKIRKSFEVRAVLSPVVFCCLFLFQSMYFEDERVAPAVVKDLLFCHVQVVTERCRRLLVKENGGCRDNGRWLIVRPRNLRLIFRPYWSPAFCFPRFRGRDGRDVASRDFSTFLGPNLQKIQGRTGMPEALDIVLAVR